MGGREVKTKSTKKKHQRGDRGDTYDSDEDGASSTASSSRHGAEVEFLSPAQLGEHLRKFEMLKDCPDVMVDGIAQEIYRYWNYFTEIGEISQFIEDLPLK